jgi:protein subunit release factor B
MDGIYGGGAGPVSSRPWFPLVQRAYTNWASVSGLTFVYESFDDGAPQGSTNRGIQGVRGDMRIGGTNS